MLGIRRALPLVTALIMVPATVALHLHLVRSSPRDGESVARPTREIRLWFSQKPEITLSTISLLRSDSSVVAIEKATTTDDTLSFKAALRDTLPAGSYIVRWRATSRDGHAVRGSYTFQQTK